MYEGADKDKFGRFRRGVPAVQSFSASGSPAPTIADAASIPVGATRWPTGVVLGKLSRYRAPASLR